MPADQKLTPFIKMHGLGNDFVVLDARIRNLPQVTPRLAAGLANRHTGIGCDQLIVLEPSKSADFRMRIFNRDGCEVGACGNAARAVAILHGQPAQLETSGGIISLTPTETGATVDMGMPRFEWGAIPLAYAMDTLDMPVAWTHENATLDHAVAVNVGNPHIVFFVPSADGVPLDILGPQIETDDLFSEHVNVNVATVENRSAIRLRVWERGAGLTRACGTGACATAVAAMRRGLVDRTVTATLPGGALEIEWTANDRILMTGPAATSFTGTFDWTDFA